MTLGLHFALSAADEQRLRALSVSKRLRVVSDELEESYADEWMCDTDMFWNAIQRAFNNSELSYDFDEPLQGVIFGGEALTDTEEDIISLKSAGQVKDIAAALDSLSEDQFRDAYFEIDPEQSGFEPDEEDVENCWETITELKAFYNRAAGVGRSVIFTVSQ